MDNWDKALEGVSKLAPLVTYDRPGIGESDPTLMKCQRLKMCQIGLFGY